MTVWLDAVNRKRFAGAVRGRDPATASEMARYFAERLTSNNATELERRVWEVAVAYSEVASTGPARRQVRYMVGTYMKRQNAVLALLELQAWAKPLLCFGTMARGQAAELTCEYVMVEFADAFDEQTVRRARRVLVEHDLALPVGR